MGSFKKVLEEYGINYEVTLRRFVGNEEFYLKMLSKLPQDNNLNKLNSALENGNLSDAFEAAHTLKGVAGNLGLTPLYQAVCMIVEPLRLGDKRSDYMELFQVVQSEFTKVEELCEVLGIAGKRSV